MITPRDKEYKQTKQIKQGKLTIKAEFKPLAEWIDKEFGVKTINIIYYTIEKVQRPALNICLEFESDKGKFHDTSNFNFDIIKTQAIGKKFKSILQEQGIIKDKGLFDFFQKDCDAKYKANNIWIVFSAFEPIAKAEANESVPEEKIQELKRSLANKDLWGISRAFTGATFFLYTEKQVEVYSKNGIKEEWTDKYYNLLQQYDEFHYFKKDFYSIYLDSKENFDKNYQGNWYYYYK
ncbi:MAG: hypothetical protein ACM3PR_02140 [Bacteroidales bacterium]